MPFACANTMRRTRAATMRALAEAAKPQPSNNFAGTGFDDLLDELLLKVSTLQTLRNLTVRSQSDNIFRMHMT